MSAIHVDPVDPIDPSESEQDYPWIRAWGRRCNLTERQIDHIERRARAEHAPATALISWLGDDPWLVLDQIRDLSERRWLMQYAEAYGLTIPESVMNHWLDPSYDPERMHF